MKKLTKKITAIATTVAMAATMVFSASASDVALHYTQGAPSSSVVLNQSFLKGTTEASGQLTLTTKLTRFSGLYAESYGYALQGSIYYAVATHRQTSSGTKTTTGSYYKISKGAKIRTTISLSYGLEKNAYAYGTISGK